MQYLSTIKNIFKKKYTIFSIPKPFLGHIGVIQYNAIRSWTLLNPQPEIFLFGNEVGTAEIAKELNLIHIPEVKLNQYGTPLLDGIFAEIHDRARNNIIVYLNADIILTNDFSLGVQSISEQLNNYLLIGRRWNIDLDRKLEFNPSWESYLEGLIKENGTLAIHDCKDYFVFPKSMFAKIPPFAVGRGYWDTWMVRKALEDGYPVVDGSQVITAIHQNHAYTHIRGGRNEAYMGKEAQINQSFGNVTQLGNIACATWELKPWEYKDLPTVSVVLVTYNQSKTIEKAILSILIQDYRDYEVIVIDRGSDDGTKAILEGYKDKISYFYLEEQEDVAYNYGLKMARGEFVTFLDGSSVMLPSVLGKQVACFEREASTLDIVLSGYKVVEKENIIEYEPWEKLSDLENLYLKNLELVEPFFDKTIVIFRRSRLKVINNFNYKFTITNIISRLICLKGCRADWLKLITHVYF